MGAKPAKTPLLAGSKLSQYDGDFLKNANEYHHLVGELQYCNLIRSNIAFIINSLCQFMQNLSTTHCIATERDLNTSRRQMIKFIFFDKGYPQLQAFNGKRQLL